MTEYGGGWTRLLRREDGSVNFTQTWDAYRNGFGNLTGEHWLGNANMAAMTRQRPHNLRIRLWDFDGEERYANYLDFSVQTEREKYRLYTGTYSGDAGDSLDYHSGFPFSTFDNDNDFNGDYHFANITRSGNWYGWSHGHAGLTSVYHYSPNMEQPWVGIIWYYWRGKYYSLKAAEMKIRPADF